MKPATSLPWKAGEYDEDGGYDCMTGAIDIGPICLDGARYGQKWCHDITEEQLAAIKNDAAYIVHACNAYPKLVEALRIMEIESREGGQWNHRDHNENCRAILAKLGEVA